MRPIAMAGSLFLAAAVSFGLACSGGSGDFQPAPGAVVEVDELEELIASALAGSELRQRDVQPIPHPDSSDGRPSCFEVETGPCQFPRVPGLYVAFEGEDVDIVVKVLLGIDELESGDLLRGAATSRAYESSELLQVLYEARPIPEQMAIGPCDSRAERDADNRCAWEQRGSPKVGDDARAMESEALTTMGLSNVAFSRGHVFAEVEVRQHDAGAPNRTADRVAGALDEQIKLALSQ